VPLSPVADKGTTLRLGFEPRDFSIILMTRCSLHHHAGQTGNCYSLV